MKSYLYTSPYPCRNVASASLLFTLLLIFNGLAGDGLRAAVVTPMDWSEAVWTASQAVQGAQAEPQKEAQKEAVKVWEELAKRFPEASDWLQQDYKAQAWEWLAKPEPSVLRDMIGKVLKEVQVAGLAEWDKAQAPAGDDPRVLLAYYFKACEARRVIRLRRLVEKAPQMVFTKHYNMGGSHYAYTEGQSDAQSERHFYPGSALCLLTCKGGQSDVGTLLEDKKGVIRDPDVSYDGKRVLFAWKKSDREDDYHLYEMELATRKVRQLTSGLGVADYEGVYLPDGDILFNSSRCVQTVDCWWTEVSNLYRCNSDGKYIHRLTFDQVHNNSPSVTDDGRILYTRWEYNDRSQIFPQPLLQMMPDGTGQTEVYGGSSWFPTTILHARGIPGTSKIMAIATGHHTRQTGKLIVLDPAKGRQEAEGAQLIAPVRETKAERIDAYGQQGDLFQYPYPLSETELVLAYHPLGWQNAGGSFAPRFGVYWMNQDGRRELLASDPALPSNQPIPVRVRQTVVRHSGLVDYHKQEGTYYVQDVYAGPPMAGVARGTVKTLRVVTLKWRAAGVGENGNGGPGGGALVSTPVAIGNGTWDPKAILGDATVNEDGSVFFKAPARTPVYFQLLDAKGRMVQSMRSWSTLQPGENASCTGCHEPKNSSPPVTGYQTKAFQSGPQTLKPFYGPARGFSYVREIQPILDAHCASCHDGKKDVPYDLTSTEVIDQGAKRRWMESYLFLTHAKAKDNKHVKQQGWRGNPDHPMVNWISAASVPTLIAPYSAGSNKSKLMELLDKGHEKVVLTREDLEKLAAWIDLGVPFCGDYTEANAWNPDEIAKYQRYSDKRKRLGDEDNQALQDMMKAPRK
ncbi:MAG: hypothetical protein WCJ66_07235 [Verrucomicrobiota bacterium]